jgi:hypothetical protein
MLLNHSTRRTHLRLINCLSSGQTPACPQARKKPGRQLEVVVVAVETSSAYHTRAKVTLSCEKISARLPTMLLGIFCKNFSEAHVTVIRDASGADGKFVDAKPRLEV